MKNRQAFRPGDFAFGRLPKFPVRRWRFYSIIKSVTREITIKLARRGGREHEI